MADSLRFEIFRKLYSIEQSTRFTFFAIVLTPDLYIYHKQDSIEFSMALMGQTGLTINAGDDKFDKSIEPGKLRFKKDVKRYVWMTPLRKSMQNASDTLGWRWFVVIFDGDEIVNTGQSTHFPLSKSSRKHLLSVADVLWKESQIADIAFAKDTFQRNYLDVVRIAADKLFVPRRTV